MKPKVVHNTDKTGMSVTGLWILYSVTSKLVGE